MLKSDYPVQASSEDKLGRKDFSVDLAKAIIEYEQKENLVMGLYGKWGSGKTSVLNMVEEVIKGQTNREKKIVILRFEPWILSDQENLIKQFFKQLSNILKNDNDGKELIRLSDLINFYAKSLGIISAVTGHYWISLMAKLGLTILPCVRKFIMESNDVVQVKKNIIEELERIDIKIVIFIDDIDRLNISEIKLIFQLIKCIADFPNTIYLLSFDRDIVVKALEDVQKGDGDEYLEKIVQIPFELPMINRRRIEEMFCNNLNSIIGEVPNSRFEREYWSDVFHNGIKSYLINVRVMQRISNVFSLKYNLLKEEVNIIDLIAISVLSVCEPNVYEKLRICKDEFCGMYSNYENQAREKEATKKSLEFVLNEISDSKNNNAKKILEKLFPKIDNLENRWTNRYYDHKQTLKHGSICNKRNFDMFFAMCLTENILSLTTIENLIFDADEILLSSKIQEINNMGYIDDFIDMTSAITGNLRDNENFEERVLLLIRVLLRNWNELKSCNESNEFLISMSMKIIWLVITLLNTCKEYDKKFTLLCNLFNDNIIPEVALVRLIYRLGSEHGMYTDEAKADAGHKETIIREHEVNIFENILTQRIVNKGECLLEIKGFIQVFYFWIKINEEEAMKFVSNNNGNSKRLARCIAAFAGEGKVYSQYVYSYWKLNFKELNKIYNLDNIYQELNCFICGSEYIALSSDVKWGVVVFLIQYEGNKDYLDEDGVLQKDIEKRLHEIDEFHNNKQ